MSIKEHARRLSAKMKDAMKKGDKDLGERHPDHKIFEVKPYSAHSLLLWFLLGVIVFCFICTFLDMSLKPGSTSLTFYHTIVVCLLFLLLWSFPGKDEHFPLSVFAKTLSIFLLTLIIFICIGAAYIFLFHYPIFVPVVPICAVIVAVTAIFLTYFGSHFRLFTYDPFCHNKNYKLTRRVDKSAGHLEIIVSRPFQIVLKNVGLEAWKSQCGYVLKRQVTVNRRRTETLIPIPKDLLVQSHQKITLIPFTEPDQEGAVKVPNFRCFGYDVGNTVLTTVGYRNPTLKKKLALLEEQFQDLSAPTEWSRIVEIVNATTGPETINIL